MLLFGAVRRCDPSQTPDFTVIFSIVTMGLVIVITLLITPPYAFIGPVYV